MPNITLALDADVIERARSLAEAQGKSLNQLVRAYLEDLAEPQNSKELVEEFLRLSAESGGDSKGWRFNRDEVYERR